MRRRDMLLAVDIGNTNIALGVFDGDNLIQHCFSAKGQIIADRYFDAH